MYVCDKKTIGLRKNKSKLQLFNVVLITLVSGESIDEIAEWQQPTYWEALEASSRRTRWGHPTDIRASADWALCPALG